MKFLHLHLRVLVHPALTAGKKKTQVKNDINTKMTQISLTSIQIYRTYLLAEKNLISFENLKNTDTKFWWRKAETLSIANLTKEEN